MPAELLPAGLQNLFSHCGGAFETTLECGRCRACRRAYVMLGARSTEVVEAGAEVLQNAFHAHSHELTSKATMVLTHGRGQQRLK